MVALLGGDEDADFEVKREGTIVLFTPLTEAAEEWLRENCETEAWQWFGKSLGVEHRYADNLVRGIVEALFRVREI